MRIAVAPGDPDFVIDVEGIGPLTPGEAEGLIGRLRWALVNVRTRRAAADFPGMCGCPSDWRPSEEPGYTREHVQHTDGCEMDPRTTIEVP